MSLEGMLYDMRVSRLESDYAQSISQYEKALNSRDEYIRDLQEDFALASLLWRRLAGDLAQYDAHHPLLQRSSIAAWNEVVCGPWRKAGRPLAYDKLSAFFKQVQNLPLPPRVGPPPPDVGAIQSSLAASSAEVARLKAALAARDQSGNGEVERLKAALKARDQEIERLKQRDARSQNEVASTRAELTHVKSELDLARSIMVSPSKQHAETAAELAHTRDKLASTVQQLHEAARVAAQTEAYLQDEIGHLCVERKQAEADLNTAHCDLADHMLRSLVYGEELSKACPDHPLFTSQVHQQNMACAGRTTYIMERNWGAVRTAAAEFMAKSNQQQLDRDLKTPWEREIPDDWQDGTL